MTYLDWNATAPLRPEARVAWLAAHDQAWANPASPHAFGQAARHAADQAKAAIARRIGAKAHELVLTSGGSEGCALAIHAALAAQPGRRRILAGASEHSAILRNAAQRGELTTLPVDGDGRVMPFDHGEAAAVCLQHANNETGAITDLAAIAPAPGCWRIVDACQSAGKIPLDVHALHADAVVIAGHKFGAPKGVGAVWFRSGLTIAPLIAGGRQQSDRRSGTEDAPAWCAMAAALDAACTAMPAEDARQRAIIDAVWARIAAALPLARRLAEHALRLPNTLAVVHPDVDHRTLIARLDLAGFALSTGSACMAARGEPSHVATAMGVGPDLARSLIRWSIGHATDAAGALASADAYIGCVRRV